MSVSFGQFQTAAEPSWRWPLVVGLHSTTPSLNLSDGYFVPRFTQVKNLDKKSSRCNILFFTDGIDAALKKLDSNSWSGDIIIVADTEATPLTEADHRVDLLKTLAEEKGFPGLFIVSDKTDMVQWFNGLLVELSHNNNFLQSIRSVTKQGIFYYNENLEETTTLDHVVKRMIHELRKRIKPQGTIFNINTRITGGNSLTPDLLASLLEDQSRFFRYDHESDEATEIATIYTELAKHYKTGVFADGKKTGQRAMKEPATAGAEPPEESARYLQTKVLDPKSAAEITNYLLPQTDYQLKVRIGSTESGWNQGTESINTNIVFDNTNTKEEPIAIVFRPLDGSPEEKRYILLPRTGNSTEQLFGFRTSNTGLFAVDIEAYHNSRKLQTVRVTIRVREVNADPQQDGLSQQLIFSIGPNPSPQRDDIKYGASYTVRTSKEGAEVSGMTDDQTVPLFFSTPLNDLMEEIKSIIQKAIMDIDNHPDDIHDVNNTNLLRKLAYKGNNLFIHHLNGKTLKGALQIVTNRPGFVPLDFVYEPPAPDLNAGVCPKAKEALEKGECMDCFDKKTSPAPHICPFGFWGLSHVIERSSIELERGSIGDYQIKAQPLPGRGTLEVLGNTLFAFSKKVDGVLPTVRSSIRDAINLDPKGKLEVNDWTQWKDKVQEQNPDSLILVVHVENNETADEDQIEIGDQQFLLQNLIVSNYIKPDGANRSPLMIVIGCETANIDKPGFDISNRLIQSGAAVVISNFTKIKGRRASVLTIKLIEYLRALGKEEMKLGQVILKLRQYLMAQGIMTGLSVIAHGDAGWTFKTSTNV